MPYACKTYSPALKKKVLFFMPSGQRFQMETGYLILPVNSESEKMILFRENLGLSRV